MPFFRRFSFRFNTRPQPISLPVGEVIGIHYFHAAVAVMILIGAFWGTLLLWQLSGVKEFTHMDLFEVNAHGQGQVYGWLCLALIGGCFRILAPRDTIPFSYFSLILIVFGIGLNMAGLYWISSLSATVAGGLCLIAAALIFCLQIYKRASEFERSSPPFLRAGLIFFFLSTLYSFWHHEKISMLAGGTEVFEQVANFQAPLRDIQIHGMALFLAAGLLSSSKSWKGFSLLLLGVFGEMVLFLIYRITGQTIYAAFLFLPWIFLFLGTLLTRLPFKWPYRWLILSLGMLLVLPLYSFLSHQTFSHAYYGAIRHAVTVGCFSQLALFLMPLRNKNQRSLFSWAIVLLNIGCLARVALQILSDFHPIGFALIPLSGATEFASMIIAYGAIAFDLAPHKLANHSKQQP